MTSLDHKLAFEHLGPLTFGDQGLVDRDNSRSRVEVVEYVTRGVALLFALLWADQKTNLYAEKTGQRPARGNLGGYLLLSTSTSSYTNLDIDLNLDSLDRVRHLQGKFVLALIAQSPSTKTVPPPRPITTLSVVPKIGNIH